MSTGSRAFMALLLFSAAIAAEPACALPGFKADKLGPAAILRVQAYDDDEDEYDYDDDRDRYRGYRTALPPPPYTYGYAPLPRNAYGYAPPPPNAYGYGPSPSYPPAYYAPRRVVVPQPVPVPVPSAIVIAPPAAAYGWSPAGGCGTYRYWNGERCVDARRKYDYRW